jgi:hypothetical protein
MRGRKQKTREPKTGIQIIGEGITEQYYFRHIKTLRGFSYTVKPRFFGNTSVSEMEKKIENALRGAISVICVFDADVFAYNESERKKLERLQNKYRKYKNVLFCDSLPSIEYWFLLHYENTNRHFNNAKTVEAALKKHVADYEKTTQFLEKEKWVRDMSTDGKLEQATQRAKHFESGQGSYTNIHKIFEILT